MSDDIELERLATLLRELVWLPSEVEGYEQAALSLEEYNAADEAQDAELKRRLEGWTS